MKTHFQRLETFALAALAVLLGATPYHPSAAGEVHFEDTHYRDIRLEAWAPTATVASVSVVTNAGGAVTGTVYYALQPQADIGTGPRGPVTNAVAGSTSSAVRLTWQRVGGTTNMIIWRGWATNAITNRISAGAVTSFVDYATNGWTGGTVLVTATQVPMVILSGDQDNTNAAARRGWVQDQINAAVGSGAASLGGELSGPITNASIADDVITTNKLSPDVRAMLNQGTEFNPTQLVWRVAAIAADSTNELVIPPGVHYFSYWNTNSPVVGTFPTNGNVGDLLYVSVNTNGPIGTFPFTTYELNSSKIWVYAAGTPGTNISFSHISYYQNIGTSSVSLDLRNQRIFPTLKYGHTISDFDGYWLARAKYAAQYRVVDALLLGGQDAAYYLDNTNSTGGFPTAVLTNLWSALQALGAFTNTSIPSGIVTNEGTASGLTLTGTTSSTGTLVVAAKNLTSIVIRATSGTYAPSTRMVYEWIDSGGNSRFTSTYVDAGGALTFNNGSSQGSVWWSGNFSPSSYQTVTGAASFVRRVAPVASNTAAGNYREVFHRAHNGTNYWAAMGTNGVWTWWAVNTNKFPWEP